MRLLLIGILVVLCSQHGSAQVREEIRLKLANGSSLVVDEVTETPQGVWYRQGNISNFLAKEKVKKIERTTLEPAAEPADRDARWNIDCHRECPRERKGSASRALHAVPHQLQRRALDRAHHQDILAT